MFVKLHFGNCDPHTCKLSVYRFSFVRQNSEDKYKILLSLPDTPAMRLHPCLFDGGCTQTKNTLWFKILAHILTVAVTEIIWFAKNSSEGTDFPILTEPTGEQLDGADFSKLLPNIPEADMGITMGCNVHCPFPPCSHLEDWGAGRSQRQG